MIDFSFKFRFLLPLAGLLFASTSAEAGFVSVQTGFDQLLSCAASTDACTPASDSNPEVPPCLKEFVLQQFHLGNAPLNGGTSSVSSVSSSAPVAILNQVALPDPGLISPLCLREIPFTPQMLIAEIFRPPCA